MSEQQSDTERLIEATVALSKRVKQLERQESIIPGVSVFYASPVVPNNAWTPIEWTQLYPNSIFEIDPLNPERISNKSQRGASAFGIFGFSTFAANATGVRAAITERYNSLAVYQNDLACGFQLQAVTGGVLTTEIPLCGIVYGLSAGDFVTINAFQNSGGGLATTFAIGCFMLQ